MQAIKVRAAGSTEHVALERSFETAGAGAKHVVPINSSLVPRSGIDDDVVQNGIRRTNSVGGRDELED